jgi:hypothetical protein
MTKLNAKFFFGKRAKEKKRIEMKNKIYEKL